MQSRIPPARAAFVAWSLLILSAVTAFADDRPSYPRSVSPGWFGRTPEGPSGNASAHPVAVQPGWFGRSRTPSRSSFRAPAPAADAPNPLTAGTYRNLNVPAVTSSDQGQLGAGSGYGAVGAGYGGIGTGYGGVGAYGFGGGLGNDGSYGYGPRAVPPTPTNAQPAPPILHIPAAPPIHPTPAARSR